MQRKQRQGRQWRNYMSLGKPKELTHTGACITLLSPDEAEPGSREELIAPGSTCICSSLN